MKNTSIVSTGLLVAFLLLSGTIKPMEKLQQDIEKIVPQEIKYDIDGTIKKLTPQPELFSLVKTLETCSTLRGQLFKNADKCRIQLCIYREICMWTKFGSALLLGCFQKPFIPICLPLGSLCLAVAVSTGRTANTTNKKLIQEVETATKNPMLQQGLTTCKKSFKEIKTKKDSYKKEEQDLIESLKDEHDNILRSMTAGACFGQKHNFGEGRIIHYHMLKALQAPQKPSLD